MQQNYVNDIFTWVFFVDVFQVAGRVGDYPRAKGAAFWLAALRTGNLFPGIFSSVHMDNGVMVSKCLFSRIM